MSCWKKKGFTLIEMISVVFLALIIFLSVIPSASSSQEKLELQYEANLLRSTIRYAQTLAMRDERSTQNTVVDITVSGYSVVSSGVDVILPYSDLTSRNFEGLSTEVKRITFNGWGVPVDDVGNELVDNVTINLTNGITNLSQTVTVLAKTGFVQ